MNVPQAGLTEVLNEPLAQVGGDLTDDELWFAFRAQSSQAAREALFLRYLPFARRTALRTLRARSIFNVELADVYQSACIGLIQAMEGFEASRGAEFTTYATYRVQGAVLSALETYSELQQQIAARARQRSDRLESLRPENLTPASSTRRIIEALAEVSMGLALGFMLEDSGVYADPDALVLSPDAVYEGLAWKQARESLQQQVDMLPENERQVMAYHYFQGLDFQQVASLMGRSRSRISQIHRLALERLRAQMVQSETFSTTA